MNIKAVLSVATATVLFATIACGCDITDFGTENLLRPPKAMGDEAEIEQLISATAKKGYVLKYPKSGNYRSAIVMTDLDNDKIDEAVAFYREVDSTAIVNMLIMYSDKGKWKASNTIAVETTDIDSIDFADIDGDSTQEIILGYSTFSININKLSGFKYKNGKTLEIKSGQNYSSFYCGDFDADGVSEIMSLLMYTTENEASATMIDYSAKENTLYSKATVVMDPNVIKYHNVCIMDIDSSIKGIVVDGTNVLDEMSTQIIYFNNEMSLLRNPLYTEKSADKATNISKRNNFVFSQDIDKDGFIEFPITTKQSYSKGEDEKTVADKISWESFVTVNETTVKKLEVVANYEYDYIFKYSEKWSGNTITARIDTDERKMTFYTWNGTVPDYVLFEIKVFDIDEWELGRDIDGYTLITKDDKYAFTFNNVNKESQYSLTDDEIKTAFSLLTKADV
ncbi:MAG: hypothetical protein U0L20_02560 [Ruminococcus sp.]|nr:hypothetical protein [Ruminococcus sp.]